MNAIRPALGIKATAAHVIFCGFSLLFLFFASHQLAFAQESTNQQARPQTSAAGDSAGTMPNSPVIRAHVREVLFDVVVTNFYDHPVSGIHQSDFSVYENGKLQKIRSFVEHSGKPNATSSAASAGTLPELPPDSVRSVPTPVDSLPLNIILLDPLNTPPDAQAFSRSQLIKLLQKKPAGMRLALFVLSDRLHLVQGFTDSDADLVAAANGKHADTYLSSYLGPSHDVLTPVETLARGGLPRGANLEGLLAMDSQQQDLYLYHRVEMTIEAFLQIAHFVSGTPGRKNLIWLSAAFPVVFMSATDPFSSAASYSPRLKDATDELTLGEVAVYPVDARGLDSVSPLSAANTHNYKERTEGSFVGALDQAFLTRATEFQIMDRIAADSGGHAFYNTNGLEYAMGTALADGSTYYTISYIPTDTKFDGSLRHIRVELESNGFRQLSYRRTYLADDPDILRQRVENTPFGRLDASMQRGAPCAHEISFTAHVAPEGSPEPVNHEQIRQLSYFAAFAGNKNWHGIQMQRFKIEYSVFGDQLRPVGGPDGARHANLDFVAAAYDAEGRTMSGQLSSVQEKLTPTRVQDISANGYRLRQHLDVPTTAAWLRVCVRDAVDDRTGCVESPLHRPAAPTASAGQPHP